MILSLNNILPVSPAQINPFGYLTLSGFATVSGSSHFWNGTLTCLGTFWTPLTSIRCPCIIIHLTLLVHLTCCIIYIFFDIIYFYSYQETHFLPQQFSISTTPIRLQEMIHPCNLLSLVASKQGRFGGFLSLPNGCRVGENHPPITFKKILV